MEFATDRVLSATRETIGVFVEQTYMGSGNRLGRSLVMFGASASVVLDIHCDGIRPSPPARLARRVEPAPSL